MTTIVVNNSLFRSLFEKQKLTGNNFMEWYHNLWILLSTEDKLPFLEQPIPTLPVPPAEQANPSDVVTTHQAWVMTQKEIAGLMLKTMDPDIQKNLEYLGAYDMLKELKTLYVQNAYQELLQTVREFNTCKQEEGQSKSHKAAKGNQGKGKAKMGYAPVNCPVYLTELIKKKKLSQGASTPEKLQHDGLLDSTDIESFEKCVACMSGKIARKSYSHQLERAKDLLGLIHTDSFWDYAFESAARILNMVPTKKVDKTPYEITRTRRAPDHMCLYIDAEEHELRDLGEPANYKAALLDPEYDNWINGMNVEMQSMKDNEVWELVDLHPEEKPLVISGSSKRRPNGWSCTHL
nr:zinc finger, CCHC-type [Tanacetum cinerariifolium]